MELNDYQHNTLGSPGKGNFKPLTTWDNLIAEAYRLGAIASKIQKYENHVVPTQGLTEDELNEFITDYLAWYNACLARLPEDLKDSFRVEYIRWLKDFLISPLVTTLRSDDHDEEEFLRPYHLWFYRPFFTQRQILGEASQRPTNIPSSDTSFEAVGIIERLIEGFHAAVLQMRNRYDHRPPLVEINDEYDVQDLFHAMLIPFFTDIRREDPAPSVAGSPSRIDFLLKQEQIVIEIKKTRENLKSKQLGGELIIDMKRYRSHVDFKTFIAFVYDPDRYIDKPKQIESDLSGLHDGVFVKVIIAQN